MNCPFSQDDQVTVDEFKQAIQSNCQGKTYTDFPTAFKTFISTMFKTIDVNGKLGAAQPPTPTSTALLTFSTPSVANKHVVTHLSLSHKKQRG